MSPKEKIKGKAWIISISNELAYQRIAYSLKHLSPFKKIINIDDYDNIPPEDKNLWKNNKKIYEFINNITEIPIIKSFSSSILSNINKIKNIYFKNKNQNLNPNFSLKQIYNLIQKGWGKHFIEYLKNQNNELPFVSTFNIPAFIAEYYNYPSKIICTIFNQNISRSMIPLNPIQTKIIYLTANENITQKLIQYGIKQENIFLTGYPFPKEIIGKYQKYEIIKKNLKNRIINLDPKKKYLKQNNILIKKNIGKLPLKSNHKLTILFNLEESKKQKQILVNILKSLNYLLQNESVNLIIACGINENNKQFVLKEILKLRLGLNIDRNIFIIHDNSIEKYIKYFNEILNQVDILWTNPNELIFYVALGIPIIISPSQNEEEKLNEKWIIEIDAGIKQQNPKYTNEWLFDLIREGKLVEKAINGFTKIKKDSTWEIEKIIKFSALF